MTQLKSRVLTPDQVTLLTDRYHQVTQCAQALNHFAGDRATAFQWYTLPYPGPTVDLSGAGVIPVVASQDPNLLTTALTQWTIQDGARRYAARYPGVIQIPPGQTWAGLCRRIEAVNHAKDAFRDAVLAIEESQRWHTVHRLFPGLQTLEIYRHVWQFESVASLRFHWANKETVSTLTTEDRPALIALLGSRVEAAQEQLATAHRTGKGDQVEDKTRELTMLERELADLQAMPDSEFAHLRRVKRVPPRPELSVRFRGTKPPQPVPASLPVFVKADGRLKITPLEDYEPRVRVHSRRYVREPVVKSIGLYRFTEIE